MRRVRALLQSVTPHGLVRVRTARRRYAARWPGVPRDRATRDLVAASGLELVPDWIDLTSPDGLFVDVGAHTGEWTAAALTICPNARVVQFEPQPGLAAALRRRFAEESVDLHEVAVGENPGTAKLLLTRDPHLASLRAPSADIVHAYRGSDWWEPAGEIEVPVATLDGLLPSGRAVKVLKIDVQGTEREVLRGASDALRRTSAILVEMNLASYYEGEATFGELHAMLVDAGFGLVAMSNPGTLSDGRLAWCDACYTRRRT